MNQNTVFTVLMLAIAIGLGSWIFMLKKENEQLKAMLEEQHVLADKAMEEAKMNQELAAEAARRAEEKIDSLNYSLIDCKDQQLRIDFSN